jgi:hypothetical protein
MKPKLTSTAIMLASLMIAVEDRYVIPVVSDVRDFAMRNFNEDKIARQDAVSLPITSA